MQDKELYEKLLGLSAPWSVQEVDLQVKEMKVTLKLTHQPLWRFRCPECDPECDEECPTHDHRQRKWRHLDTCGYVTMIEADVPRVDCPKHGVRQAHVPWAEPSGRFTSLFEAMTISWLKVATIKAVSEQMKISWDEATGIPLESWERAVERGLARRESRPIEDLAVDETSFQKRHEYLTVLTDQSSGTIIEILDDRKKATLKEWLEENQDWLQTVRSVSMDMWEPFINAVRETIQGADQKICFDRFHVAAYFGMTLDKI